MKNKTTFTRVISFTLAALLLVLAPLSGAQALFGKNAAPAAVPEGAPVCENMEVRAFGGVPYTGMLKAVDNEGEDVTFAIAAQPKKGTVVIADDGIGFVYTPTKNKTGADSFTYTATDASGNTSLPATVRITVERTTSGVSYADTADCSAATAAMDLAERDIFTGTKIGSDWFFEPQRAVSRGEFIAMTMAASGKKVDRVTMTGFCDDASIPTWCKSYASCAYSAGIINGVTTADGVAFDANAQVTLSEAAAVLDRLLEVTDVNLADYEACDSWSAQALANLESVSVLQTGSFAEVQRGLTRADAAGLLSAALTLREGKSAGRGLIGDLFA